MLSSERERGRAQTTSAHKISENIHKQMGKKLVTKAGGCYGMKVPCNHYRKTNIFIDTIIIAFLCTTWTPLVIFLPLLKMFKPHAISGWFLSEFDLNKVMKFFVVFPLLKCFSRKTNKKIKYMGVLWNDLIVLGWNFLFVIDGVYSSKMWHPKHGVKCECTDLSREDFSTVCDVPKPQIITHLTIPLLKNSSQQNCA